MDKNGEGIKMEPPHVLWPDRDGGSCQPDMAGAMLLPEDLQRKTLFSLLYNIDLELTEQTRARRCPSAGGLYIVPTTCESLAVAPLTLMRLLRFALACVAAVKAADAVSCRHRCVF
jgi:hypothetical protein